MSEKVIKPNVYIEFDIIRNSNPDALIEEFKMIIGLGRVIIIWSKIYSVEQMIAYCLNKELQDYIWDYKIKDSFFYSAVDFIIDNNKKLVDRFIQYGKLGNYIERIE